MSRGEEWISEATLNWGQEQLVGHMCREASVGLVACNSGCDPNVSIHLKNSHGLKESPNERMWLSQGSHLPLGPKDHGAFWEN